MNGTRQFIRTPGGRSLIWLIAAFAAVQAVSSLSPFLNSLLVDEFGLRTLRLQYALSTPTVAGTLPALATLATYSLLHGGWLHLLFNSMLLAGLGLPVAAALGPTRFLFFFALTSIGAGIAHVAWHWGEPSIAVGASGAVFAAAAARAWLMSWLRAMPPGTRWRFLLGQAAAWMLVNALIWLAGSLYADVSGSGIAIAWAAHAGGYATGALLAPVLLRASVANRRR